MFLRMEPRTWIIMCLVCKPAILYFPQLMMEILRICSTSRDQVFKHLPSNIYHWLAKRAQCRANFEWTFSRKGSGGQAMVGPFGIITSSGECWFDFVGQWELSQWLVVSLSSQHKGLQTEICICSLRRTLREGTRPSTDPFSSWRRHLSQIPQPNLWDLSSAPCPG
jgi:hypothetical protein